MGDSAAAVNAQEAPRVAPVAIEQGRVAARNVRHLWRGEPLETYEYASKGMLVSLGMNYAVVKIGGIRSADISRGSSGTRCTCTSWWD